MNTGTPDEADADIGQHGDGGIFGGKRKATKLTINVCSARGTGKGQE